MLVGLRNTRRVFPGKDVRVSHAVSSSDVHGVVKQLTLPEAECGASVRGEAFAVDCASRPEAVVVFLFPELRADHVSQWGGAYAVNSARSGAFGNLRKAVEETASASVTASLVYMQGGASLSAQVDELVQQLGVSRVMRVGSADQLATLLSDEGSERFADGITDLVLVDLPTPYGRSSALRADSEMAQVSALMDLATASRVAFVAAAGGSASLAEHASRANLVGESYSYFPPAFWEPFMVMLFIGFIWLVGVNANLAVQSPSRFFSAKSGKRGALSAER